MPFNISGGIEDDDNVPGLVNSPPESDDEDYLPLSTKVKRIPGEFPWSGETVCYPSSYQEQATRWLKLSKESRNLAHEAMKRLLLSPFLFQQLVIPEKWLRWAHKKSMITFDFEKKILPSGKLLRDHYLVVRMFDFGLRKLQMLTEKKKTVIGILKSMYSIRNVASTDVDKAIKDTRGNENVKTILEFIRSEVPHYVQSDRSFFDGQDRLVMTVLFCFRQFAEVVHIIACEGRDISTEVKNYFTDQNSQNDHNADKEEGNKLYKSGKYHDAIDAYTKAIDKAPYHYLLYSNRCQALIKLSAFEPAFADAYRTIILQPDFGKGYYKVVLCLSELGYLEEALDWGQQGLSKCDEVMVKNLKELIDNITSKTMLQKGKNMQTAGKQVNSQTGTGVMKKKPKAKKKKKKNKKEEEELLEVPDLVSDDEFEECPAMIDKLKKDKEEEMQQELKRKQEKEKKKREEKVKKEKVKKEKESEFELALQKGASDLLRNHYVDACKAYNSALDIVDACKEISGYSENDVAILLYTRGVASQRQGLPLAVDQSRHFFRRIINEYKIFSHLCMVYYANAKSTYLLNDFAQAKEDVSTALQLVKKFPVHGVLTWPGSSENIPESDEALLRRELKVLLRQCKVPPIPTALCKYEECTTEYSRKQMYLSDIDFEGYFEVRCDWDCVLNFHLRCWAKFKHDLLNLLGDKEVLGMKCFTPDCEGKISLIKMFDEHVLEKRTVGPSPEHRVKNIKVKPSKHIGRMPKSELNLMKYREIRAEKVKQRNEMKAAGNGQSSPNRQETRTRNPTSSDSIPADQDLSDATIYVKDHSQKARGKGNRRIVPASLQHFCSSLPGYSKEMTMKEVDKLIKRAKADGVTFPLPDDVREEMEQFVHSFGGEESIQFTDDQKIVMLFLFEYFVHFFTEKGPLDTHTLQFTNEFNSLPESIRDIVSKCGGLVSFLNSSPLFIQVPPYIGIHSQHQHMKKHAEKALRSNNRNTPPPHHSLADYSPFDFEDSGMSQFAKEFYQIGANVEESDLLNLTGFQDGDALSTNNQGDMYKLEEFPVSKKTKTSQNSETSSMYSMEDFIEAKSESSSQTSYDAEKAAAACPASPTKRHSGSTYLPQTLKEIATTSSQVQPKKMPKKKFSTISTQTEGQDDSEKDKEAVARLQERLLEMEDEFTKLKRTSQTREESLLKQVEQATDREKLVIKEKEKVKQAAEVEIAKVAQFKRQVQAAEAKAEQCRLKEKEMEMNVLSLTEGMQRDRDTHLGEIAQLRRSVEAKEKEAAAGKRRATNAEVDLVRTKEAYHVGPHIQAKNHCEQGVREFDTELVCLSSILPDQIMHQFKLARKIWADNVIACNTAVETLKAAYSSIIDQVKAGRPLSELPPVPELKPPPPGPNPRHMMIQLQRRGLINLGNQSNGGGDGSGGSVPNVNGSTQSPVTQKQPISNPLPALSQNRVAAPMKSSAPVQPPIGSELPKAPKKKNFLQLVDKLCKNVPQLTREQVEICVQRVRTDNKGLTGLLYEEIELRIRGMAGLDVAQVTKMPPITKMPPVTTRPPATPPTNWKLGSPSAFYVSAKEAGDFWDHEDEAVCPICCDPLKDRKVTTLDCQHKFHFDCIGKWMQKQRTCPNCRKFMADTSEFPSLVSEAPPGLMRNHN